jgi:hypothetical protein
MRFQVISMERPPEGAGLPPPSDYTPCYSGVAKGYDTNGDGHVDKIKVTVEGKERCYGEDSNHDDIIDTWDILDVHGNLERRAHDSNGDGKVDQTWTFDPTRKGCGTVFVDRNGDGRNDLASPMDLCPSAITPVSAPLPAPVSSAPSSAPSAATPH